LAQPTAVSTQSDNNRCIIIGGGIAGLALALALAKFGIASLILEKSDTLEEVGAGLQLSPNATSILADLGVLEGLLTSATVVQSIDLLSARSGKSLLALPTAQFATPFAPFLALHRADLQAALLTKVLASPAIELQLGCSFLSQKSFTEHVEVAYKSGDQSFIATGLCLVGADGVWSSVRQQMGGAPAVYSGYVAYRQTIDRTQLRAAGLSDNQSVKAFVSPHAHMVAYPISHGKSVNLVFIAKQVSNRSDSNSSQSLSLIKDFASDLAQDLARHQNWTKWPLYVVSPDIPWQLDARTILVGDAAHAMLPFGAQGAAMAIEDASTLAYCLHSERSSVSTALMHYEKLRRARIGKVSARGRLNALAYHASGPVALARNLVFAAKGQRLMNELAWLYAYRAPHTS
jgi:salicylate hydroxylase